MPVGVLLGEPFLLLRIEHGGASDAHVHDGRYAGETGVEIAGTFAFFPEFRGERAVVNDVAEVIGVEAELAENFSIRFPEVRGVLNVERIRFRGKIAFHAVGGREGPHEKHRFPAEIKSPVPQFRAGPLVFGPDVISGA